VLNKTFQQLTTYLGINKEQELLTENRILFYSVSVNKEVLCSFVGLILPYL